jgi:hypothetical protein
MVKHNGRTACGGMRKIGFVVAHRGASGDQLKQMMVNHVARYLHPILFFSTMKASVHRNRLHVNAGNIRVSYAFPLSMEPLFRSSVRAL